MSLAIFGTGHYRGHLGLTSTSRGWIQEFWVGGRGFFQRHGGWGPSSGPKWVQGNVLDGSGGGGAPPEAPEYFSDFRGKI